MKRLIIVSLLFLYASTIYSQISWNAKAGINMSRITNMGEVDMKPGYQFGVGADYYFNDHWGIQSSLILISKGFKQKGNYNYPPQIENPLKLKSYNETDNRVYMDLPIALAYRFYISDNVRLIFNGGGFISYGIAGKFKNKITHEDGTVTNHKVNTFGGDKNRFDTGLVAGSSIEYKNKYIIGLFGEWGLRSVVYTTKNQTYGLSLGYKF